MHSGKQTHSGQCRWWSAVYCICWPKAEFPLRQGPRPVFVKTLYTLSILAQTHAPNSLKLVWTKEKERHKNSSVKFSRSVESDSLQPHESQQARPPYPSPSLPELIRTHIHRVGDAIQPSHPLSPPFPPAPSPSQNQSLFQWVNSSHEVAKVLEFHSALASFLPKKSQGWSPSEWAGWISLQYKGLSFSAKKNWAIKPHTHKTKPGRTLNAYY